MHIEGDPHSPVCIFRIFSGSLTFFLVLRELQNPLQHQSRPGMRKPLPARKRVTGTQDVTEPYLRWIHTKLSSYGVHHALQSEKHLGSSETPESSVGRRIGSHRLSSNPNVFHPISSGSVKHPPGKHHGAESGIGSSVKKQIHVENLKNTLAGEPCPQTASGGMPLGSTSDILRPFENHLHGPLCLSREKRRMQRQHRGIILLASESASGYGLPYPHFFRRKPQAMTESSQGIIGTLHGAPDFYASPLSRQSNHALGFQVHLLLVRRTALHLQKILRLLEGLLGVSFRKGVFLEKVGLSPHVILFFQSFPRIQKRRQFFHLHLQSLESPPEKLLIGSRHQGQGFTEKTGLPLRENGMIRLHDGHLVGPRKILGSYHHHPGPVEIGITVKAQDLSPAKRRSQGSSVPHGRKGKIIHIACFSRKLIPGIASFHVLAYDSEILQSGSPLIFW